MYDAVIFDMDGVVIHSEPVHVLSWLTVLSAHGAQVSPTLVERGIGVADEDFSVRLRAELGLEVSARQLLQEKRQTYRQMAAERVPLGEGIMPLLEALRTRCRLGLATCSPRDEVDLFLDHFALRPYFDAVAAREDVVRLKPFPDLYEYAARQLDVLPSRCVAVEDSPTGIKAARNAGMPVVAVATTHTRYSLSQADIVIASLLPTQRALDALATVASGDEVGR